MKKQITALVLALIVMGFTGVSAQEATDVPTAPPVIIDGGEGGTDTLILPAPEPTPAPVNTGALLNLVAAILIGVAGGGTVLIVFDRVLSSREVLDNTERAYESLSPQWQDTIRASIEMTQKATAIFERALQFADRATDKLPNDAQLARARLTLDDIQNAAMDLHYSVSVLEGGKVLLIPPPTAVLNANG